MIIDPHAHIAPEAFIEDVRAKRFGSEVWIEPGDRWEYLVTKTLVLGKEHVHRNNLPQETYDVEMRLGHMKQMGVDRQILSVAPPMTFYGLEAGLNQELAISLNDSLSALAQKYPDQFSCMATAPLQVPQAAADELERAVKQGHLGVEIGSNVAGKNLDEPELDVFWEKAVSLDVPIFIHPIDVLGSQDRLNKYHLRNFIGNPLDTTIAVASLIFGGVLDRFPNIKFYLSHAGGFVPWIRGRWQHGYGERTEPKEYGAKAPEEYFGRFYYDTIIHNAEAFQYAVNTLGADIFLYGTDYPFDMGYLGSAREIPGLAALTESDQEKILCGNAQKLYKL